MIIIEKLENNIDHVSFSKLEKLDSMIADDVKNELLKLFDIPNSKVILDLKDVKYIDSSGFGCFLTSMKAARNNYGKLKICNIDPVILTLFRTLHLHTIIDLREDIDSCINSF